MALQSIVNDLETRCFRLQNENCELKKALMSSKNDCEEKLHSLDDLKKELDSSRNAQELILEEIERKNSEKIKSLKKSIKDKEKTIKNLEGRLEPGVENATQTVIEDSLDPQHSQHEPAPKSEAAGGQSTATHNDDEPTDSSKDSSKDRDEVMKSKIVAENKISDGTVADIDDRDANYNHEKPGTEALCPQLESCQIRGNKTTKKHSRCNNATKIKVLAPPVVDAFKKETSNNQPFDDMVVKLYSNTSPLGYTCNGNTLSCKKEYGTKGSLVKHVKEIHPLQFKHWFNKWQTEG